MKLNLHDSCLGDILYALLITTVIGVCCFAIASCEAQQYHVHSTIKRDWQAFGYSI